MKVMSAIERCRTAALGGHVARCENGACGHTLIAYNSCRNRHCPKCQGAAARDWLEDRKAELLPVPYFHVVYTLPAPIADLAFTNKAVVYDILFKASAQATITIAADRKRLGAKVGITSVLHTWGSAMVHHPHVARRAGKTGTHRRKAQKSDGRADSWPSRNLPRSISAVCSDADDVKKHRLLRRAASCEVGFLCTASVRPVAPIDSDPQQQSRTRATLVSYGSPVAGEPRCASQQLKILPQNPVSPTHR